MNESDELHGRLPILHHCLTLYAGVVVLDCHHIVFNDWRRPMKVQRLWHLELKFETVTRSKDHRGIINASNFLLFIFLFFKRFSKTFDAIVLCYADVDMGKLGDIIKWHVLIAGNMWGQFNSKWHRIIQPGFLVLYPWMNLPSS